MKGKIIYKTVIKEMAHTRHQSLGALYFILCSLFFIHYYLFFRPKAATPRSTPGSAQYPDTSPHSRG